MLESDNVRASILHRSTGCQILVTNADFAISDPLETILFYSMGIAIHVFLYIIKFTDPYHLRYSLKLHTMTQALNWGTQISS